MRKTPLRRVSKKRSKELAEYRKLKKQYLAEHPYCEVCEAEGWPRRRATDIHHVHGRSGGAYLNPDTWLAVSRLAHDRIHWGEIENGELLFGPSWARCLGYLK